MEFTGKFVSIVKDWASEEWHITFSINEREALQEIDSIRFWSKLSFSVRKWSKRRSVDANALMWVMISQLAAIENVDKWQIYLECLKSYGKCMAVTVNATAYEDLKKGWREVEEVGRFMQDGIEKVSCLCYFGSSLLTSDEFSHLLDGIKHEMIQCGLQPPASAEMRRALEEWENTHAYIPQDQTSNQSLLKTQNIASTVEGNPNTVITSLKQQTNDTVINSA